MPDRKGRFMLYSDTSKNATGSALYQTQDGKHRLIAYASKRMPEAAQNYPITELEMSGLAINILSFSHLLKKVDFDAVVDHLAIKHIMKSKAEPVTNRINRLLEVLGSYAFNLYYIKGKDMVLSEFLSGPHGDNRNSHEIIPISFNVGKILKKNHQNYTDDIFLVTTRSQSKIQNKNLPCSGIKPLDKTRKPMKPIIIDDTPIIINGDTKPDFGTQLQVDTLTEIPNTSHGKGSRGVPYIDQVVKPSPRPHGLTDKTTDPRQDIDSIPNLDFEENLSHQEGIISETYVSPDQSYFDKPQELGDFLDTSKIVPKKPSKANRYRQDFGGNKEESVERNTFDPCNKRNTSRIFE